MGRSRNRPHGSEPESVKIGPAPQHCRAVVHNGIEELYPHKDRIWIRNPADDKTEVDWIYWSTEVDWFRASSTCVSREGEGEAGPVRGGDRAATLHLHHRPTLTLNK